MILSEINVALMPHLIWNVVDKQDLTTLKHILEKMQQLHFCISSVIFCGFSSNFVGATFLIESFCATKMYYD